MLSDKENEEEKEKAFIEKNTTTEATTEPPVMKEKSVFQTLPPAKESSVFHMVNQVALKLKTYMYTEKVSV